MRITDGIALFHVESALITKQQYNQNSTEFHSSEKA